MEIKLFNWTRIGFVANIYISPWSSFVFVDVICDGFFFE